MDKISLIIGENLKKVRYDRGLSLDQTSDLTGVSKAMLGQIERGESNPTVATLGKIVNGLDITYSALMRQKNSSVRIIKKNEIEPVMESDNRFNLYPIVPSDNEKQFEVHIMTLEPSTKHQSEPHNDGVEEYVFVSEGTLEIEINENTYVVNSDDSIIFDANRQHLYRNNGSRLVKCLIIMYYPI